MGSRIQLQQRNCSGFTRDFSRRLHVFQARKELTLHELPRLRFARSRFIYQSQTRSRASSTPNFLITGGAGFIGSNLTLTLQEKFPDARADRD